MSTFSHPWLNNDNAKPTADIGAYRWAARSLGMNTRGVDSKEIRDAVNNQLGIDSDDPSSAMSAFQRLAMSGQSDAGSGSTLRPQAPFLENNNTQAVNTPIAPVEGNNAVPGSGLTASDHPFKVTVTGSSIIVSPNSFVFAGDSVTSMITVGGLNTPISAGGGDLVWLEITFSTWPAVSTITVQAGSPPSNMFESSGGVQTVGRKIIAQIASGSPGLTVTQYMTSNQVLRYMCVNGLAVYHPPSL